MRQGPYDLKAQEDISKRHAACSNGSNSWIPIFVGEILGFQMSLKGLKSICTCVAQSHSSIFFTAATAGGA